MPKSFLFERSRGRCVAGMVPIATTLALAFAACAHGIDNGLDFESSGGGPPIGAGTTIGATTGNAGPAVGASGSGAGGRGGSVGGSGGMSGLTGSGVSTGSGTGGSIEDGGASTSVGSGGAQGGSGGAGQGGTGGQAGMSGQGGSGGRDGGPEGGAVGGSAGSTGGSGGVAGRGGAAGASGMGGAAGSVVRDAGPLVSYDDSVVGTGNNQFNYAGTWGHCAPCTTATTPPLFNTSNSWADGTTPAAQILSFAFVGSEVLFYGVQDPRNGIGAISIDAGAETNIDFYATARGGDHLLWTSPFLPRGPHTLRLHPTGTMSAASTGITITVDRVEVH